MPITSAAPVTTVPTGIVPSSKRGKITSSITHWIAHADATVHRANTAAPPTAVKNRPGCTIVWWRTSSTLRRNDDSSGSALG